MKGYKHKLKQDPNLDYIDINEDTVKVIIKNKKYNGEFLISKIDKEKIQNYF